MGILVRLHLAKIQTMAQPHLSDMQPNLFKKVQLDIYTRIVGCNEEKRPITTEFIHRQSPEHVLLHVTSFYNHYRRAEEVRIVSHDAAGFILYYHFES